jgi:acetyl/propionyl-CoA carboxylase alpha subunit
VRECPAPALDDDLRDRLVVAAERVAGALRHLGPGAVEFLVGPDGTPWLHDFDPGVFRGFGLHDAVYGLSFVGAAIRIAAGEALGWDPDEILPGRAAVEVELRATGPGELEDVSLPEGVEVSTAVAAGSRIDPARDAVLATLRVTGPTRHAALVRAHAAVEGASFDGVPTDAALVLRVLADSRTWAGRTSPEVFATAERE